MNGGLRVNYDLDILWLEIEKPARLDDFEAFLEGRIAFPQIAETVEETLNRIPNRKPASVSDILCIDEESRVQARDVVSRVTGRQKKIGEHEPVRV